LLATLDQEDDLGIIRRFNQARDSGLDWDGSQRFNPTARAHTEGVNGLTWSGDGNFIISAGLDRRIRVWDANTGANTLASFGSLIQNRQPSTVSMFVSPAALNFGNRDVLFWPNEQEILVLDLRHGTLITRLRIAGAVTKTGPQGMGSLNVRNRTMDMVWRGAGGHGLQAGPVMGGDSSFGAVYSAHLDGQIRAWMPRLTGPEDDDFQIDLADEDEEDKKRKRKAVDDAFKSLMGKQVTFS
jgi:DNA excision repair protein ERCC-8